MDATMTDLLTDLNAQQREAVTHGDGPLLILAGPGSGKTRVVTRRAAYLACTIAKPWQILAITFTNKAAREMRERIEALDVAPGMTVCTFHALCAKLLRVYHERADVSRDFSIVDRDDRRKLVKLAIKECDLATDNWSPAGVERRISLAKGEMLSPAAFETSYRDWYSLTVARIYRQYETLLAKMAGLDFDDLLMRMALLLQQDEGLCQELEARYPYVLIDEYQDTNTPQYTIARLLTQANHNICATGDPDQSIYGWRGANIENILSFERDYPTAKVVRLEQNYRSTKRILSAADCLIAHNEQRKSKNLWTENAEGLPIAVHEFETGSDEADWIAEDIGHRQREGIGLGDMAIFYRVNSLSRTLEESMIRAGIPYQIARGVEFYCRKEIKDVLGYLRVLVNPSDDISLLRIINTPTRGIGATTVSRLQEQTEREGRSLFDRLTSVDDLGFLGRSAGRVAEFGKMLQELKRVTDMPLAQALTIVIKESGLRAFYARQGEMDNIPLDNLNELVSAAVEFEQYQSEATLRDWLEHTALVSDVDALDDETERVTLMTLHAAKGLEFPVAYLIGLEDGLLPLKRQDDGTTDMEEERRLLFVGITRAKQRLTLTHARYRLLRGTSERTVQSPFLDELPRDALEWHSDDSTVQNSRRRTRSGTLPEDIELWAVGSLVRDPIHGLGQVLSIQRGSRRTQVAVQFRNGPRRNFLLEFAQLERVDFDDVGDLT